MISIYMYIYIYITDIWDDYSQYIYIYEKCSKPLTSKASAIERLVTHRLS